MKKSKIINGILLAMSFGLSCQAIAQTTNSNMRSLQQLDQYPTEPDPGYYDPPTTQPTAPTRTSQTTSYNQTDINANSKSHCVNKDGTGDSTCFSATGHSTTQSKSAPTAITIKPFARSGASCTTPWGQIIQDNSEVAAFQSATGTYNYGTGSYAGDCVEEQRHCTNGVLSGSYQFQNCNLAPVNGTCGTAHGSYYTYPTSGPSTADQCNPAYTYGGVAPPDESPPSVPAASGTYLNTSNNMYYWSCSGEVGGSSASCYAYRRINGQCGTATNTCNLGNSASPGSYNNYYPNYACSCSTNTSGTTTCSANPSGNQTCAGAYKDTTYTWSCTGINTGNTASCASNTFIPANNTPPSPPCGASYQPQTAACGAGYTGTQSRSNYVDNCTGTVLTYGSWNTSSCVCSPTYSSGTDYAACPSGYTGTQSRSTSTNSCTGVTTYGAWNTSSCSAVPSCTVNDYSESSACPSGYSGTRYRTRTVDSCNGTTYSAWDTSGCTANPSCTVNNYSESASCPSGYSGTRYRTRTVDSCNGTSYSAWDTSGCTANPSCTVNNYPESASCPSGYTGTQYRTRTVDSCNGTSYSGWDTSGCTAIPSCTVNNYSESASCPSGYTGTQYRTRTVDSCNGTSYSGWDTSGCTAVPSCPPPGTWCGQVPPSWNEDYEGGTVTYSGPSCTPTYTTTQWWYGQFGYNPCDGTFH